MSCEDSEDFPGRLLHQAALWDNAELLEDLLNSEQLCHLDCQDAWGRTPIHAAATTESSRCLRILLQAGANPNMAAGPRAEGKTPLHVASAHGASTNVKLLLDHGADLLSKDVNGLTALDVAEQGDHQDCMRVLREAADARELARQELHNALREACARGDAVRARAILRDLGSEAEAIVNSSPNGSNTLLFKACEEGLKDVVQLLLEYAADGRSHPVTKYSPLYIACYYGRKEIVEMLLRKFPSSVNVCTVEKWLPIHACIINGHIAILEMLLKFPYQEEIIQKYRDKSGCYEYEMAFDINMRDVTGQNALYLASYVGNQKIVEHLLKFRVPAIKFKQKSSSSVSGLCTSSEALNQSAHSATIGTSPTKLKISGSIQALMSKLNFGRLENSFKPDTICPLDIDMYCNSNTETALHVAVKNKHYAVVSMLLAAGADPNLRIYLPDQEILKSEDDYIFTGSTALVEACRNRDMGMLDLLLKNHARDDECKALFVAANSRDEIIVSKLLTLKVYADPEFKINKKAFDIKPSMQFPTLDVPTGGVYTSLFPSLPAMINWHGQRCLSYLKEQWLIEAAVSVNQKLKLSPKNQAIALYAITRLDISNNALSRLPDVIFHLPSLRVFNASQNKIEQLPSTIGLSCVDGTLTLPRKTSKRIVYSGPMSVLEEIHLKDNRLNYLPDGIFTLPALQHLDVSNNKLSSLPYKMWTAPKLRDLNVSLNLLSALPVKPDGVAFDSDSVSEVSDEESSLSSLSDQPHEESLEESPAIKVTPDSRGVLSLDKHGNVITCCRQKDVKHHSLWVSNIEVQEAYLSTLETTAGIGSSLQSLNLAHNTFTSVPRGLPCLALSLYRLNLSYNRLSEMGFANCYPVGLKQLDLSHNLIRCWPGSFLRSDSLECLESGHSSGYACCALNEISKAGKSQQQNRKITLQSNRPRSSQSPLGSSPSSSPFCIHRRHSRLEALRTLIVSDNQLSRICMYLEDNEFSIIHDIDETEITGHAQSPSKPRLLFPSLSMLDIGNNFLRELPVLNISGNVDITELPPEMGLLSRLWNLNTRGCSLQEPLKSMIESKKYKTMDVIGYLKSIFEDARPYAHMKLMIVGVEGIGKTSLLEQLRPEGTGVSRKKPSEHWAKRMGNKNINTKTSKGTSMSTVGVDIGDWIFEKKIRGHSSHGPVVFRTWDFGGQREYYATHQYFLSKRSLYLVVWKISDGESGVSSILQWLVNIQSRAPNSPVIIVGTHYDEIKEKFPSSWSEDLQQMIRDKFINVIDADKLGLPRVLDTIEVSCKTRHNIKLLCNLIYDTVFSLKTPGSKERLLEQRIPASYLALEDVVGSLALERRVRGKDPVLLAHKYQTLVSQEMYNRGHRQFRDIPELNQATAFLHENGVMLHYEDATLRNLYFLDPQWLCDMLAHVVTIREINPFAHNGIMKLDDLKHVFKSSTCAPVDAKSYIVNLLNKFEVALTWDNRTLLIPSLLPTEDQMRHGLPGTDIRIPVRSRGWVSRSKKFHSSFSIRTHQNSLSLDEKNIPRPLSLTLPTDTVIESSKKDADNMLLSTPVAEMPAIQISHRASPCSAIHRLVLMSYFPSGFWSRLITRMLADDAVVDVIRNYFVTPREVLNDTDLCSILGGQAEWICWQTGMELHYANTTLFRLREYLPSLGLNVVHSTAGSASDMSSLALLYNINYKSMKFLAKQDGQWSDVELNNSAVLEILLPNEALVIRRITGENCARDVLANGIQSIVLDPASECVAKLLSFAIDHIDTLLEDWYPTLGTRFVHTSEGKFLVTRLVPCPPCLYNYVHSESSSGSFQNKQLPDNWGSFVDINPLYTSMTGSQLGSVVSRPAIHNLPQRHAESVSPQIPRGSWGSRESYASDGDSGVGPDSASSSRNASAEGRSDLEVSQEESPSSHDVTSVVYSFMVEECILAAHSLNSVTCPVHFDLLIAQIAPDTMFLDLGDHYLIPSDTIKKGKMLGRGGFGFVFQGTCKDRVGGSYVDIALKMLQPVDPGPEASLSTLTAFKASQSKWERDPLQYACKAYCSARQEVSILLTLRHPNIVPLVGVCTRPLALVLELAPQGALDQCLKHYQRSGARLLLQVLQSIILQIAKALEYLHGQHIIYRDLKSENVLVWHLPPAFCTNASLLSKVDVKLADYGISRSTLPTGTKGFGGTEGFMAPEMMKHSGEEEYTEKVDCFSFGMFMYELVTMHQPYEQCDNIKEHVLEGGRPSLTHRETMYPAYILDLMVLCWSQQPHLRPSASQIVSVASAPEFTHLLDVVSLDHPFNIMGAISIPSINTSDEDLEDKFEATGSIWISRTTPQLDMLEAGPWGWHSYMSIEGLPDTITSIECVGDLVWLGDSAGNIHGYSKTYSRIFTYCLEPDAPQSSAVKELCCLEALDRVAVALGNGRLFICLANKTPTSPVLGEGSFVVTELATSTSNIYCMTSAMVDSKWTLWCGGCDGIISVFTLRSDGLVVDQETLFHFGENPPLLPDTAYDVCILYSLHSREIYNSCKDCFVWSYVHPGCVVYQWNCATQSLRNKLDCSKLVPCSESLQSISIEEHLSPSHCQVSSVAVCGNELYVGTTWGCIVVAEAESMKPITVFRPYEEEVRTILPLGLCRNKKDENTDTVRYVATIGKGYRNLLSRYVPMPKAATLSELSSPQRTMYCMLWRAQEWLNT